MVLCVCERRGVRTISEKVGTYVREVILELRGRLVHGAHELDRAH